MSLLRSFDGKAQDWFFNVWQGLIELVVPSKIWKVRPALNVTLCCKHLQSLERAHKTPHRRNNKNCLSLLLLVLKPYPAIPSPDGATHSTPSLTHALTGEQCLEKPVREGISGPSWVLTGIGRDWAKANAKAFGHMGMADKCFTHVADMLQTSLVDYKTFGGGFAMR